MNEHSSVWTGQAETTVTIQANIDSIDTMQSDIEHLESQLSQKKKAARTLEKNLNVVADTIENKAIGFHTATPDVLQDYGIEARKTNEKKPLPTGDLSPKIQDELDGHGFNLTNTVDPDADRYEWERGVGADPTNLTTIPTMQHFKNTSKTTFVDEAVLPGVRYFYRVRALNATGDGAWSPIVSRVKS
ncbi:MAG: fibronectin type III domain-containing protein [Bacteroidota bacterium]